MQGHYIVQSDMAVISKILTVLLANNLYYCIETQFYTTLQKNMKEKFLFKTVPYSIRYIDGKWYKVYQRSGIDENGYFLETITVEW